MALKVKERISYPNVASFLEANYWIPALKGPVRLASHQKRLLADVFTADSQGRLPYQTVIYSAPKKSGKTELGAMCGFAYAYTQGPWNEIYFVANDLESSQSRGFRALTQSIEASPYIKGWKIIKSQITIPDSRTIFKALSTDYASEAGANPGLTVWDELWAYMSEAKHRLYDELTPVPTRRNSMRLITTYAGYLNESDLLWDLYEKTVLKGERIDRDYPIYVNGSIYCWWDTILRPYPGLEIDPDAYHEEQRQTLRPAAYARLHENQWVNSVSPFIDMDRWDSCVDEAISPLMPSKGTALVVAVDAATKHDSAAVVAVSYENNKIRLARHHIWQPSAESPLDIENTIEATLRRLCREFSVQSIHVDPYQMQRTITTLARDGLPIEEFPQSWGKLAAAASALFDLVNEGNLVLYPDAEMRRQAQMTVALDSDRGWRLSKTKSAHKIDAIVALAMACHAALQNPPSAGFEGGFTEGQSYLI